MIEGRSKLCSLHTWHNTHECPHVPFRRCIGQLVEGSAVAQEALGAATVKAKARPQLQQAQQQQVIPALQVWMELYRSTQNDVFYSKYPFSHVHVSFTLPVLPRPL